MSAADLPPEVLALIHGPVRTYAHVELLLALHAREPEPRPLPQIMSGTSVTALDGARRCLDELAAAGLVARAGAEDWRFAPRDAAAREAVESLARMFNEKPVTLVRALYERPTKPLQSFTDAFRLRNDE